MTDQQIMVEVNAAFVVLNASSAMQPQSRARSRILELVLALMADRTRWQGRYRAARKQIDRLKARQDEDDSRTDSPADDEPPWRDRETATE